MTKHERREHYRATLKGLFEFDPALTMISIGVENGGFLVAKYTAGDKWFGMKTHRGEPVLETKDHPTAAATIDELLGEPQ